MGAKRNATKVENELEALLYIAIYPEAVSRLFVDIQLTTWERTSALLSFTAGFQVLASVRRCCIVVLLSVEKPLQTIQTVETHFSVSRCKFHVLPRSVFA